MRRWSALAIAVFGCQLTGTIGRDDPYGGGSGGGTVGGSGDTEAVATDGEVGGSAEGEGSGAGSEGETTGGTAGGSSESTASIPHACIPTPDDSDCSECRKTNCCEPLESCLAHEPCPCWWECIQVDGHTSEGCAMLCGADGSLYDDLQTCTHDHCDACL
jgi:hypothetical protein